jgi:hypothetical protein
VASPSMPGDGTKWVPQSPPATTAPPRAST